MNQEIKDIITEWIYEIYKLKNFNNVAERNIWEAEVKEKWDQLNSLISGLDPETREDYEEEIDNLREDMRMLIERRDELLELNDQYEEDIKCLEERNFDLQEENEKLKIILTNVSEAINVTWN